MRLLRLSAASDLTLPVAQPLLVIEADVPRLSCDSARRTAPLVVSCAACGTSGSTRTRWTSYVWRVSGGGQSTELVGSALSKADDEGFNTECCC